MDCLTLAALADQPAGDHDPLTIIAVNVAVWAVLIGTVLFWVYVVRRWHAGQSVLPYEPRRPVPWDGGDLAIVLLFYIAASIASGGIVHLRFEDKVGEPAAAEATAGDAQDAEDGDLELLPEDESPHVVLRLVTEGGVWPLVVSVISVVIVAPLVEEFLFRLLLLGWLERLERRWRQLSRLIRGHRSTNSPRSTIGGDDGTGQPSVADQQIAADQRSAEWKLSHGAVPVALSSLLFAMLHFRSSAPPADVDLLIALRGVVVANAVVGTATLVFAVMLLRVRHDVTLAELGVVPGKLLSDVRLGLVTLLGVFLPVMAVQLLLKLFVFTGSVAPDPVALFLLAVAMGVLYYRTHRIVPSIAMHAGFNLANLALAALATTAR